MNEKDKQTFERRLERLVEEFQVNAPQVMIKEELALIKKSAEQIPEGKTVKIEIKIV